MENPFNRAKEDIGNIVRLEHVNVEIPDQQLANAFYVMGLGLTRDPYLFPGTNNMWINVGNSQFHLPTGDPLVLRGHVGLVVPDLEALIARLGTVKKGLSETKFGCKERNDCVEATCPWGNRIRLHAPDPERFGPINLGMPYVAFDVPEGTADAIARFYREILGTVATVENGGAPAARVMVGHYQCLLFRETDEKPADYDGHHIAVYVENFSAPHDALAERGLITEESDQYQYRFQDIIDLDTGKCLFTIEHEVRSLTHPLYGRHLVNRNPAQTNRCYQLGADEWNWALPVDNSRTMMRPPKTAETASPFARRRARRLAQQVM
jgi:catechol 2,3-dioxygenase-like lactoylglutathione lyase family enzyme